MNIETQATGATVIDNASTSNTTHANDEGNKALKRGTLATAGSVIGLLALAASFLAEHGNNSGAMVVSQHVGNGKLGDALDAAIAETQRVVFGTDTPVDNDGKALYVGMHPFKPGTFGIYRTELRDQVEANRKAEQEAESKRKERALSKQAKAKEKIEKAQARAKALLAKADEMRAEAEKLAATVGVSTETLSEDVATEQEAEADLVEATATV